MSIRAARFLGDYLRTDPGLPEEEVVLRVAGEEVEGTFYPPPGRGPAPAWVVLHGLTVPGRRHASLLRFVRALRAAGNAVLVPDVPRWRALVVDSAAARETIEGGAAYLAGRPEARPGGVSVVGFSMGATMALVAAADPRVRSVVRTVVGFGGYCDMQHTMRCMCTGEYEWEGRVRRMHPDPYGRWIVAGNFLTGVPEYHGMGAVAEGLRTLAIDAGRRGVDAGDPVYDVLRASIRRTLAPDEQEVWDLLAPPAARPVVDLDAGRHLARRVADAALAADPGLDPGPVLPALRTRVVLAHGRADRLIPYTETLRMRRALPAHTRPSATVSHLFAHSTGSGGLDPMRYGVEVFRFFRLLGRALAPR
ncbi:MAG TPA: hypothetical protein VGR37_05040 [Longimicrobiaceae bacterium]|nr:hypothetical protein [Longimicrobiaceae bacterium]